MLSYLTPPGCRRTKAVKRLKLEGFSGVIASIVETDTGPGVPCRQRYTAHRVFERLRVECGFTGGYPMVNDYVRFRRTTKRSGCGVHYCRSGHGGMGANTDTARIIKASNEL